MSSASSVSILEPLAGGIDAAALASPPAPLEETEIDQDHLIRAILALTETDTPVHSRTRPEPFSGEDNELARLRAEAERDFAEWQKTKRLLRRNTSLGSTASTVGSPMQSLAYDYSPKMTG